jgi:peroxiredoxin
MKNTQKAIWCSAILAGVVGLAMATPKPKPESPPPPTTKAKIGQKAPAFSLTDIDGTQRSLADSKGKIVVIEWFNAGCPYSGKPGRISIHDSGRAAALRNQLKVVDPSITYLLIDSTAYKTTKADIIAADKAARAKWKIEAPILIDFDGKVGHAYRASSTPHMFVIDADGVLRYQGAFDDNKPNEDRDDVENYVLTAVKQLKAGEEPSPSRVKQWGCSVKYGS